MTHENLLMQASEALGGLDTALIAYGTLGDQALGEQSVGALVSEFQTNALSAA